MSSTQKKENNIHYLSQKRFFKKAIFELSEKSLKISNQQLFRGKRERVLRLDEIGHKYEIQQSSTITSNFLTIFFLIFIFFLIPFLPSIFESNIISLFLLSLFFIPILLGILLQEKVILLQAKAEPLVFFWSKKDKAEIELFVNEIIQHSKRFLVWKFGQPDKDLPKDKQIDNFKWLRDNLVITEEEYQVLKQQLNQLFELRKE